MDASDADGGRRPWSLRTHLLGMAGAAVALSAVVGVALTARAYSSAERRAVASARDAARQTATTLSRDLAQAGVLIAASAPGIGPTLEQAAAVMAAPELCILSFTGVGVLPAEGVLNILTADGRVLCSSNRSALGRSYADAPWYARLAAGETITVDENADVVTGGPAAVVAAPVRRPTGSIAGALVSIFSADRLAPELAGAFRGRPEREYTIVDPSGTVISSSIDAAERGRRFPEMADGETASDSRRTERIWSVGTVQPTGWRVWAATSEAQALGPARAERQRLALVLVVALAAAVALALLVNRRLVRPVRSLSVTVGEAETEPGARAAVAGPAELAGLARSLNHMLATRQHNEQLVSELAAELEATAISLIEAREQERQALAISLHDTTLQGLVAAMWQVDALAESGGASPALDRLRRDLGALVDQTRAVTTELRPPALHEIGLGAAVDDLARRAAGDWNLLVDVEDRLGGVRFAVNLEMLVYRAIQECLQNVRKHAGATRVQILLERRDDALRATVADDGIGVDDAVLSQRAREGHLGVASMRDTIRLARGCFSIACGATGGTVVELEVPLSAEKHSSAPA